MKKVLVITYYWPPSGGSGVQRWVKFCKYLPSEGWQPVVYTPENPELTSVDDTMGNDLPEGLEVLRTQITEPYEAYRRIMGRGAGTDMKKLVTPIKGGKKSLSQKISLWIRGNLFIPDPRVWWVGPSVRFLRKYLKDNPVDVIVTTGPPQSMHLIGKKLAKATGTPWIPDFRDPWTRMYYLKHLGLTSASWKKHHRLEKSVLDAASAVIAVTPLMQEELQAKTKTPVRMITNGFDEDDFAVEPLQDGFFNLTHTGLLASDGNPERLWAVLGEKCSQDPVFKEKLRIRLVGKTDADVLGSITAAGLEGNTVNVGYKAHLEAVAEQKGASALLLPLRNDPEYKLILPGKLFEYLAARRPILGIGQTDGAMARVIAETGSGAVSGWEDGDNIRLFIDRLWAEFLSGGIKAPDGDISEFSRKNLTRRLAATLGEVSEKSTTANEK